MQYHALSAAVRAMSTVAKFFQSVLWIIGKESSSGVISVIQHAAVRPALKMRPKLMAHNQLDYRDLLRIAEVARPRLTRRSQRHLLNVLCSEIAPISLRALAERMYGALPDGGPTDSANVLCQRIRNLRPHLKAAGYCIATYAGRGYRLEKLADGVVSETSTHKSP